MEWIQIEGEWNIIKDLIREEWEIITDDYRLQNHYANHQNDEFYQNQKIVKIDEQKIDPQINNK